MNWNVRKLISPLVQCTSITNRFLSLVDRFTAYYNCLIWNIRKIISSRFQCTSITNRFLSLFDRFTAYYSCLSGNLRKLISPWFQCTNITKTVFLAYLTVLPLVRAVWVESSENSYLRDFSEQVSQIVFLVDRFTFYYNCWPEMSENSYLRDFS